MGAFPWYTGATQLSTTYVRSVSETQTLEGGPGAFPSAAGKAHQTELLVSPRHILYTHTDNCRKRLNKIIDWNVNIIFPVCVARYKQSTWCVHLTTDVSTIPSWWNSHQKLISTSQKRNNYGPDNYCSFQKPKPWQE